jgi:ADP-ribose pyrophosphatase
MAYEVVRSEPKYDGAIIRVVADTVTQPGGSPAEREVVEHPASVAVVALDDRQQVLLIRQYRHPARQYLWELPAGLCDTPGEPALAAARRDLAEETGLEAADWVTLADVRPSPGISTEVARIYQAGRLSRAGQPGTPEGEERDLQTRWVPLPEAVDDVLAGRITNGLAVAGLLAAAVQAQRGDGAGRAADAPWPGAPS